MEWIVNRTTVRLIQGDITEMETDAIVNAANAQLILGGGVAGAISRKGGPSIQAECNRIGGTIVGGTAITGGGNLKAKYVIHAVGPRMGEGDEEKKLILAVRNSLTLADENGLTSIALPAISTGIFGYPMADAARVMLRTVGEYLQGETGLAEVVFCLFDSPALELFEDEARSIAGGEW
jgi:O-acetyl-ADP-ribose deacetylase (regulator of RNase III)